MKNNFSEKSGLKFLVGIFLALFGMTMPANTFADNPSSYIQNNPDGSQILMGHVPSVVKNGTAIFKSHASLSLSAQIIMPLANQTELSTLLQDLYNPKSPSYHQWLTPAQFSQQFTSSALDTIEVKEFLGKYGISVTGQSPNGTVLNVTGASGAFEQAFGMHINYYQKSDRTLFFAPDAEPTIPANLAGKILAVGGLDNLPKYMAHSQQNPMALPKAVGSGPGGYLAPSDVKTLYNLNSVTANGSGQKVALFELDGYSPNDISAYDANFKINTAVPLQSLLQNVLVDGFSGAPDCTVGEKNCTDGGSAEVTLDIELVTAFAPGSSSILVYEAPNTTAAWMAEWQKIASDNKAKVISCSWGEPEQDSPTLSFDNEIFEQMAAQGQAVFVAAGDSGAFDAGGKTLSVDEPASQPYATAVGISKLTTNSNGTYTGYTSESASVYGGGGVSAYWSIPSYQTAAAASAVKAALVSTKMRNLPDVVLTADASTGYAFYIDGAWAGYYGSSIASPIWASFISCVNQGLGAKAPVGSVNTAFYQLAQTSGYTSDFHDINTGNNGYYPAEPGFDDATGLGSFNGLNLYNALLNVSVPVAVPPAPTGLSAVAGNGQVGLSWSASLGAVSYDVKRSTTNGGTYTIIASSVLNNTYTDTSVVNATTYYYVVSAVNTAGQSANSAQVSATPTAPPAVVAPTGLTGSATTYAGRPAILLKWTQSSSTNITSNGIYYSIGNGSYVSLGSVSATTSVIITGVSSSVTYNFYITAVNKSGVTSPASNKIAVAG